MVHPTAVVHPNARLDPTVEVGPFAVIDEFVVIGPGCRIGAHVHVTGRTEIGANNRFYTGAVIGEAPQDLKYRDEPTRLRIGDNNVFREHVTVHRANSPAEETVVGSGCFFMASCHVGHNSRLGDRVIIANGALLGGHVQVDDGAFISGTCLVHQFTRVGALALMQGGAGVSKDLPPFTIATGNNGICGLNTIGLRRAGFSSEIRLELRRLYHFLFRSGRRVRVAAEEARTLFQSEPARLLIDFICQSRRGVCLDHTQEGDRSPEDES